MIDVSVITVVLNGANTIEQTIQSVIKQDYPQIEYIIIDGGSTDGTLDVIKKYRNKIDFFVSESDRGLYDAMNKGIGFSKGQIVGIVNSDDWYENDAIQTVVSAFNENPNIGVLYGDMYYVEPCTEPYKYEPPDFKELWHLMSVNHPATFVRSEIYNKFGLYDISYKICGDVEIMNRFWRNHVSFGHVDKVLSYFRVGGLSCTRTKDNLDETKKIIELFFEPDIFASCLLSSLSSNETPIYIWGAGHWGSIVAEALSSLGMPAGGFYDTDETKWGKVIKSLPVLSPKRVGEVEQRIFVAIDDEDLNISDFIADEAIKKCEIIYLRQCLRRYSDELVKKYGDCKEIASQLC